MTAVTLEDTTMRTTTTEFHGLTFDIASLTSRDVGIAVDSCWEHDDCWADDCYDALHAAAAAVLQAAKQAAHDMWIRGGSWAAIAASAAVVVGSTVHHWLT